VPSRVSSSAERSALRIGINALYLIPVASEDEIYLRCLLEALAELDSSNQYVIFTNRETGGDLAPRRPNFTTAPQPVRAIQRPARILWEQPDCHWPRGSTNWTCFSVPDSRRRPCAPVPQ